MNPIDTLKENGWTVKAEETDYYGDHIYLIVHASDPEDAIQIRVLEGPCVVNNIRGQRRNQIKRGR